MSKKFPPMQENILEGISKIIGDGLTGTEIDRYLSACNIVNTAPGITKWKMLFSSLATRQNSTQISNDTLKFIQTSLHPSRFINQKEKFENIRSELNKLLSFVELEFGDDGKFRSVAKSTTIAEAEKRASSLLAKLKDRNVHDDVLRFCKSELLQDNYFHAVFEATKSVADKIRVKAALSSDGAPLIDEAFSFRAPILTINGLITDTDESEHKGFANLLKGFFGMFRNTTAHAPRITWEIHENDALDMMSLASLCHRRLDSATKIR
jgi:uncharacterized protein (TIGR02391 family)